MTGLLGVVLAGGLSRRMQGPEKAFLKLNGTFLIEHVTHRLEPQVSEILINANGDPSRFSSLGYPVQADTVEGFAGPLAGVLAGMRWAEKNTKAGHIITAAADTPFFPEDYVACMSKCRAHTNADIVLASSNDRRHPVFGLWPVALADNLEGFLIDEKNRKVMMFVERYSNCTVAFNNVTQDPFFNLNTPDDLTTAEKIASEMMPT